MLHRTIPEELTAKRTDSLSEGCLWRGSGGGRAALGISETATGSPRWADDQLQSGEMCTALYILYFTWYIRIIIYIYSHAQGTCCWPLRMDHHFIDFKLNSIQIMYPIVFNSLNMRPICTNIVFCSVGWFHPCSGRDAGIDCLYSLGYCWGLSGGWWGLRCRSCTRWCDVRIADLMFWIVWENKESVLDIIEQWYIDIHSSTCMFVPCFVLLLKSPCPPVFAHYSRFTFWCVPWCIISKDNIKTYGESLAQACSVRTGRIRDRHGLKFGCFERICLNGLNLEVLQFLGHPRRKKHCVKHWMTRDLVCNTMTERWMHTTPVWTPVRISMSRMFFISTSAWKAKKPQSHCQAEQGELSRLHPSGFSDFCQNVM